MAGLVEPGVRWRDSFLDAMAEFAAEGVRDSVTAAWIEAHGPTWREPAGFQAFLDDLAAEADPAAPRPPDRVPSAQLWWADGEEYVGRMSIRHELNDWLQRVGGHIGYDVRPSRRREGHATAMLAAALPLARELGIDRALVTCDLDNHASRRTIERNGGVLEDERDGKLRYWITT